MRNEFHSLSSTALLIFLSRRTVGIDGSGRSLRIRKGWDVSSLESDKLSVVDQLFVVQQGLILFWDGVSFLCRFGNGSDFYRIFGRLTAGIFEFVDRSTCAATDLFSDLEFGTAVADLDSYGEGHGVAVYFLFLDSLLLLIRNK